jgi:Flp pilus assembly protein TadD
MILACYIVKTGRDDDAERLLNRAVELSKRSLGPDHPETARRLGNLASALAERGQLDKAEPLLQRALLVKEKTLGQDHPNLTFDLINLGIS